MNFYYYAQVRNEIAKIQKNFCEKGAIVRCDLAPIAYK